MVPPFDLLWPLDCGENDVVVILSLALKKYCMLLSIPWHPASAM